MFVEFLTKRFAVFFFRRYMRPVFKSHRHQFSLSHFGRLERILECQVKYLAESVPDVSVLTARIYIAIKQYRQQRVVWYLTGFLQEDWLRLIYENRPLLAIDFILWPSTWAYTPCAVVSQWIASLYVLTINAFCLSASIGNYPRLGFLLILYYVGTRYWKRCPLKGRTCSLFDPSLPFFVWSHLVVAVAVDGIVLQHEVRTLARDITSPIATGWISGSFCSSTDI